MYWWFAAEIKKHLVERKNFRAASMSPLLTSDYNLSLRHRMSSPNNYFRGYKISLGGNIMLRLLKS